MVKIEKLEDNVLIEGSFLFGQEVAESDKVNLRKTIGQDMQYGGNETFICEFPGEYDRQGHFIKVYEGDESSLNYVIKLNGKKLALIQDPTIIEKENIEGVSAWLYTDPHTQKVLEKLEIEGTQIDLNA